MSNSEISFNYKLFRAPEKKEPEKQKKRFCANLLKYLSCRNKKSNKNDKKYTSASNLFPSWYDSNQIINKEIPII